MRIMGLDFGSRTVGVGDRADSLLLTAQGVEIIRRKEENKLRQTLAQDRGTDRRERSGRDCAGTSQEHERYRGCPRGTDKSLRRSWNAGPVCPCTSGMRD